MNTTTSRLASLYRFLVRLKLWSHYASLHGINQYHNARRSTKFLDSLSTVTSSLRRAATNDKPVVNNIACQFHSSEIVKHVAKVYFIIDHLYFDYKIKSVSYTYKCHLDLLLTNLMYFNLCLCTTVPIAIVSQYVRIVISLSNITCIIECRWASGEQCYNTFSLE